MKNRFSINFFQLQRKSSGKIKDTHQYFMVMRKLYLVCNNYAAVYDFQSNLLLDDELREFGKIPYELSELPNGDMKLTKSEHFSCQESYLIAIRNFLKHTGYMSKKVFL